MFLQVAKVLTIADIVGDRRIGSLGHQQSTAAVGSSIERLIVPRLKDKPLASESLLSGSQCYGCSEILNIGACVLPAAAPILIKAGCWGYAAANDAAGANYSILLCD